MWMQRLIAVVLTLAAVGCGGSAASVSGTVTLDGQPLATGNVNFYPDGAGGAPAYGTINAQGGYSLSTGSEAGLAPGAYVAVVVATKEPAQALDATRAENPPVPITPTKYGNVVTSDLKVQVKAGKNDVPLALTTEKK